MITNTMLYLYVETPLHAGVGSGLSSIDLPIQRERTTQYPMIQGSGIKGKLRSVAEDIVEDIKAGRRQGTLTDDKVRIMFGPRDKGVEHAGALIVGDARILLFPVRSLSGVFAYTTSIDVLNRFMRDVNRGNGSLYWQIQEEAQSRGHIALVTTASRISADDAIVLEEFSFTAKEDPAVDTIATWIANEALPPTDDYKYWRDKIKDSLVILPEDDFRDFVVHATEIITRISIDRKTKTAAGTALWTEEHLPTDTLLYVPIYATDSRKAEDTTNIANGNGKVKMQAAQILAEVKTLKGYLQLGGDETVGRGMVQMCWKNSESSQQSTQK